MSNLKSANKGLVGPAVVRLLGGVLVLLALFFWPAGTFNYWEAWVYLAVLLLPLLYVVIYLYKKAPDLFARRMKMKEKAGEQSAIIKLAQLAVLAAFLLPGFDRRFEWSDVPVGVVVGADGLVLLGYLVVFLTMRENRFASRVVEVAAEQTVISSGSYAVVRHPMYLGMLLMCIFSPLALGSYWAMIPTSVLLPALVLRIKGEEKTLAEELKGYSDYMQKVRWRLVPGIW